MRAEIFQPSLWLHDCNVNMNSYTPAYLNQYFNTWCQVVDVEYDVNPARGMAIILLAWQQISNNVKNSQKQSNPILQHFTFCKNTQANHHGCYRFAEA